MRLSPELLDRLVRFVDSVAFVAFIFVVMIVLAGAFATLKNLSGI